jgi:hypothetical protein
VLARLAAQHQDAAGYVFVEDKHSTLEKVSKVKRHGTVEGGQNWNTGDEIVIYSVTNVLDVLVLSTGSLNIR